jgi:TolB protein
MAICCFPLEFAGMSALPVLVPQNPANSFHRRHRAWTEGLPKGRTLGCGRRRQKLTKLGKGNDPSWSPDGKTILFSAPDAENKESRLFLMDAKGQNVRALTKEAGEMGKWSPDGKRIVYSGKIGEEAGIIVMNTDGSGAKVVYKTPNVLLGFGAQWSADEPESIFFR